MTSCCGRQSPAVNSVHKCKHSLWFAVVAFYAFHVTFLCAADFFALLIVSISSIWMWIFHPEENFSEVKQIVRKFLTKTIISFPTWKAIKSHSWIWRTSPKQQRRWWQLTTFMNNKWQSTNVALLSILFKRGDKASVRTTAFTNWTGVDCGKCASRRSVG